MNSTGNAVTDAATNEPRTRDVTPPHTTPHHTTKNRTPVATEDMGAPHDAEAFASIHPLDALSVTVCWLRPDWSPIQVRKTLARMTVPWRDRAVAALRAATDPEIRTPWAIENLDGRRYEPTPTPPTIAELRQAQQQRDTDDCGHGDVADRCALCRHHIPAQEPA